MMTSHEERAREWLKRTGVIGVDQCDTSHVPSLAAEFAAVEAEVEAACVGHADAAVGALEKRVAVLEAALHQLARLGNGDLPGASEGNVIAQRTLSGEPTALLALLERAAMEGVIAGTAEPASHMQTAANIAKRVWEGR